MSAPDNTQNAVAGNPAKLASVVAGMEVPLFKEGPGKPQINSAEDMNVLVAVLRSLVNMQITRGDSDKVIISEGNWVIQIAQDLTKLTEVTGGGGGATNQQYLIKSVQDDYVTARTWDGTIEGGIDILIAKEPNLRCSATGRVEYGVTHTYTYAAGPDAGNKKRTNSDGTNTETEVVTPPWVYNATAGSGEVIYAITVNHTGVTVSGTELTLLMSCRSGQWATPSP